MDRICAFRIMMIQWLMLPSEEEEINRRKNFTPLWTRTRPSQINMNDPDHELLISGADRKISPLWCLEELYVCVWTSRYLLNVLWIWMRFIVNHHLVRAQNLIYMITATVKLETEALMCFMQARLYLVSLKPLPWLESFYLLDFCLKTFIYRKTSNNSPGFYLPKSPNCTGLYLRQASIRDRPLI